MQFKQNAYSSIWWLLLWIVAIPVVLALTLSLWAVMVSLWAVFASVVACALGGVVSGVCFIATDHALSGLATIAAGLVCAGLSIFLFFGCREATKGLIKLTKAIVLGVKGWFVRKGEAQ